MIHFVGSYKRNASNRQSYYQLMNQVKRATSRHNNIMHDDYNGERAYYDFKNGIYF
jgi:hypothetical protein